MRTIPFIVLLFLSSVVPVFAQENVPDSDSQVRIREVAMELIEASKWVTLITLDESGHPQARTMDTLPPDENFVIWLGTNRNSAKVKEIRNDSRATLHYQLPSGQGYVLLRGNAELIDDEETKSSKWIPAWKAFYPDESTFILIKILPMDLEVVSFKHGLVGDMATYQAPGVDL